MRVPYALLAVLAFAASAFLLVQAVHHQKQLCHARSWLDEQTAATKQALHAAADNPATGVAQARELTGYVATAADDVARIRDQRDRRAAATGGALALTASFAWLSQRRPRALEARARRLGATSLN